MKSNELRIGNDIKLMLNDEDFAVIQVTLNDLEAIDNKKGIFEPIPLTEEWLLKFGFEKIGTEWRLNPSFEIQILVFNHDKYNGVMFYTRTIHTDYSPIYCTNYINYVHQLQNLYFALTNEELTIKN